MTGQTETLDCNCVIGWVATNCEHDEEIRLYDYINQLKKIAEENNRLTDFFQNTALERSKLKSIDYLDRRKNLMRINNFCPECGNKINIKQLKNKLKTCAGS